MTALAVIAALVGAMFIAFAPARAEVEVGDIHIGRPGTPATANNESAVTGFCVDPDISFDGTTGEITEGPLPAVVRTTVDGTADSTLVTVLGPDNAADSDLTTAANDDDADENDDFVEVYCNTSDHNKRVGVTPNGTITPNIDVKSPAALMILDRSTVDGAAGGEVTVRLLLLNFATADSIVDATPGGVRANATTLTDATSVQVDWLRVSGALDGTENPNAAGDGNLGVAWGSAASGFADFNLDQKIIVPGGTAEGSYTVTARVIFDRAGEDGDTDNADLGTAGDADEEIIATATFSVGDPGDAVGSAELTFGNEQEDNPNTVAIEQKTEEGTDAARGGEVWLRLVSKTSTDAPSVSGDITSVTVIAPGAKVTIVKPGTYASGKVVISDGSMRTDATSLATGTNSAQANDPEANTLLVKVEKADSKPGSVDVEALVIGEGSKADSEILTVIFGGPGKNLVLGDAPSVAPGKMTEFSVEATDDGGNDVAIKKAGLSFSVKDEDGKPVPATKLKATQSTAGKSTPSTSDDDPNSVAVLVTAGPTAEAGVYTISVTLVGASGSTTDATVIIGGSPDSVDLLADPDTGDANDQTLIKVTATIRDANGALVVDGTRVEFSVLGTNLAPIGPGHAPIETQVEKQLVATGGTDAQGNTEYEERTLTSTVGGATTKDGEVSVTYVVTGGGSTIVNATTEGGSASGNLRIATTDSTAPEDAPVEVASVDCLSNLAGFSTWTCGASATASEIFAMISGRGATAVQLWNGSMWVRYSVVDGAEIPGSSDFMVTEDDILYVSN